MAIKFFSFAFNKALGVPEVPVKAGILKKGTIEGRIIRHTDINTFDALRGKTHKVFIPGTNEPEPNRWPDFGIPFYNSPKKTN